MNISAKITTSSPRSRSALAIAVALGVSILVPAFSNADNLNTPATEDASIASQQQYSLTGPIFVGPVEAILAGGKSIRVLGVTIDTSGLVGDFLPAQYVAVFGTLSADGAIMVDSVMALDEVYAPGSSLVLFSGLVSTRVTQPGQLDVGNQAVDGLNLPGAGEWINSQNNTLVVVTGTQSMDGAPIVANTIISFIGDSFLEIGGSGLHGIDGSGIRGIDGSGLHGIDGSGLRGIDGSGLHGIDGSGLRGIDGSGIRGIDGSGLRGIDGSGLRGTETTDASGA